MHNPSVRRALSRAGVAGRALKAGLALSTLVAGPAARGASPARVNEAIDRGKAFLYARQHGGNWEVVSKRVTSNDPPNNPSGMQFGGMTALATFALLACGESPQDAHLKQAVEWLKHADVRGTYAISLRAQVWGLLPQDASVRRAEERDLELLTDGLRQKLTGADAEANGFFGYGQGMPDRQYDHSVSQFGVLGLWSLAQAGLEVDTKTWRLMDKAWRAQRRRDGAWCYLNAPFNERENGNKGQPTGIGGELLSMTAAGVATLFITQDYANAAARCDGNAKDPDIAAGLQWVSSHFDDIDRNEWSRTWDYYTLFGIARIGLASGYKAIGPTDWFQWGADRILARQDPDGAWGGGVAMVLGEGAESVDQGVYDTGFALLFLSRGRAPVLFNKLQYNVIGAGKKAATGNWNQRPREVANLTRYIGKQAETTLNWQIVDLTEKPADLLDAPILFVAGNQVLKLAPGDVARLRDYVEQGGIILGHADCSNPGFAKSFRELGAAMFPGQAFRPLPADHPILASETFRKGTLSPPPAVEILDNGVRAQMLLLPTGDPGRVWQVQEFPKDLRKYPFGQLMMDVYAYATDNGRLTTKGDTYLVRRRADVQVDRTLRVARIRYAGNWDPEPAGWPRLGNILHNGRATDLDVRPVELGKGQLTKDFVLADLTGTSAFTLAPAERKELADYVAGGGTLLVDAAGGREAFGVAAQTELVKIFPAAPNPIPLLPASSPVYTAGGPLGEVAYRRYARERLGKLDAPRLRGFDVGGRTAVLLSTEDLAAGLVGQPVDGIVGYAPTTAVDVAEHVVQYAGK